MPTDNKKQIIAITTAVEVTAAAADGESKGPAQFSSEFYTGGAMRIAGWDLPIVIDLEGLENGNVLVANLDHDPTKRVGNFEVANDGQRLVANGTATAATEAAREVVESAKAGYKWQASLEVSPTQVQEFGEGEVVEVNGQSIEGPLYVTRKGTLKGFAFVSHGADDNTTVSIAASAATNTKEPKMDISADFQSYITEQLPGTEVEALSKETIAVLKANFDAKQKASKETDLQNGFEKIKAEKERQDSITSYALELASSRPLEAEAIRKLAEDAIEAKWDFQRFRVELMEATFPTGGAINWSGGARGKARLTNEVIEAAICMTGRLGDHEKMFSDEVLQTAHDRFRSGIGLKQLLCLAAEANGYRSNNGFNVDLDVQRAAFGQFGYNSPAIRASGFSTLSISNVLSNVANKFLREGWNYVDMTPMRISAIRNVSDFKQVTTVSLTADLTFEKVGADGQIKHGTLGDLTYTNQADTYARMLAITRKDIINDDLGALTAVPRKLGRGAALKLNDIFWTEFLDNSSFFSSGNSNVSTDTGALGLVGLQEADAVFAAQTDPDGNVLGAMPAILLVPTALKTTALQLMTSEKIKGDTDEPDANVWRGRFRVESSPYMSNSSYTGYSAAAWYLLADPNDLPVIEIAALNGRVEPTVETADADFNQLGIQMRGYSDVGVNKQEYRGGVRADGSTAD